MEAIDSFYQLTSDFTILEILLNLGVAFMVALFIYHVYRRTYRGVLYQHTFNVTVVMVCVLTCMIMMVIGSNLAMSLGLVGALSIVRFRTAVKDPSDVAFLFWAVAGGLSAGAGAFKIAFTGSAVMYVVLLLLNRARESENPSLLTVRLKGQRGTEVEELLSGKYPKSRLKMKKLVGEEAEYIYELRLKAGKETALTSALKEACPEADIHIIRNDDSSVG